MIEALEALLNDTRALMARFEQAQADHKLADDWLALIKLYNRLAKELQHHQLAKA